ncbi:MAG: hypothetical protein AAGE65_02905 [Planctomycetota bacterium]
MLQTVRHARRVAATLARFASPTPLMLAMLLIATAAPPGSAQNGDALSQAVLQKNGAWNADEARQVETFISANLAAFADEDADAEEVAEARERLLVPLNDLRAEAAFQAQYFRAIAAALRNGLPTFTKIGRINAMMLGSRVVDASVVPMLETGIVDEAPGVRYAAARSMLVVLNNEALGIRDNEKARLIRVLGEAASVESNGFVAGKLIDAIRTAEVSGQRDILLSLFNARVPLHAADPGLTYQPELTAMQELFISGLGQPGGFGRDAARAFIQAAARYIRLTTAQIAADVLPAENRQPALNLANQCFTVLDTLAPNAGQAGQRPANPVRSLPGQAERAVQLAEEWPAFLAPAPLNLNADELSIDAPAAAEPQGESPAAASE